MSVSCFADVLKRLTPISDAEVTALTALEERQRHVRRGEVLQREHEPSSDVFILRKGMMMSYVLLKDGSRQILRFLFPGDLLGVPGMVYREAPETLCAMSDSIVCPVDRPSFSKLVHRYPRLGALILIVSQVERVSLTDRLATLGRTSAKARVGALLLELRDRLRATDGSIDDSYALNLTQEEIGDATGLTSVHVNRMLRQLEDEGLIARSSGKVTLRDEAALATLANYVNRYENFDLGWLPQPD